MRESLLVIVGVCLFLASCGTPSSTTTPASRPAEWQTVADWSGSGIKQTESFTTENREWRIYWKTQNEPFAGAGILQVSVHNADTDAVVTMAANKQGTGSDMSYVRATPGRYYLSINSANIDWQVRVEDQLAITGSQAAQRTVQEAPTTASLPPNQSAKDLKDLNGWRGAEWGMTRRQVETVLKQPLREANPENLSGAQRSENSAHFEASNVTLGRWVVNVTFGFRNDQLTSIYINFPEPTPTFHAVLNELTATYGKPTAESNDNQYLLNAMWSLPKTEIECERQFLTILNVTFKQRAKAF